MDEDVDTSIDQKSPSSSDTSELKSMTSTKLSPVVVVDCDSDSKAPTSRPLSANIISDEVAAGHSNDNDNNNNVSDDNVLNNEAIVVVELDENGMYTNSSSRSTSPATVVSNILDDISTVNQIPTAASTVDDNRVDHHEGLTVDELQAEEVELDLSISSKRRCRRRRSVLTLQQKLDVIRRMKKGEKLTRLAAEYGVGKATVSDLKRQESRIEAFMSNMPESVVGGPSRVRRTMRKPQEERVERALHVWLKSELSKGNLITGPVLMDMAKLFHRQIYGETGSASSSSFKASTGWLHRFKQRNGIKHSRIAPSKITEPDAAIGSPEARDDVRVQLDLVRAFIQDNCIDDETIYTVGTVRLHWRSLPFKRENENKGSSTDYVDVLCCISATGNHRLKLVLISDGDHGDTFGNASTMPFNRYRTWDADTFAEWFRNEFVDAVMLRTTRPVILLADGFSSSGHSTIQTDDCAILGVLFSSAAAFVAQPVNKKLFDIIRHDYRKSLVNRIVGIHRLKQFDHLDVTLKDAGYMLNEVWMSMKSEVICKFWKDTLRYVLFYNSQNKTEDKCVNEGDSSEVIISIVNDAYLITAALKRIFTDDDINEDVVTDWLSNDIPQAVVQLSADEPISVTDRSLQMNDSCDDVTDGEAYHYFSKCLGWLERQPDCDPADLQTLWRLQNIVVARRGITMNNKTQR